MTRREAFLAGERPDDVALFLADDAVSGDVDAGEAVAGGRVLVVPGEGGRAVVQRAVGVDAMEFAQAAGRNEGRVAADLTGGECPDADPGDDGDGTHAVRFVFAFVEAENEAAGGRYAEGDVVHAYAQCSCGTAYADRWVAGERQ